MSTISEEIKSEETERLENIDYKMVTFSLAGKDYGIDIMRVKEISKANRFTHVPNAAPYVRGVYNLRGDIISIIDMRILFNLPAPKQEDHHLEDMIILRLDELLIGIIVDSIDKVVGINSETIQPPHPIFGDINIKFIKGVVENEDRLYLILDVERIFGASAEQEPSALAQPALVRQEAEDEEAAASADEQAEREEKGEPDYSFIIEAAATFKNFHVSDFNRDWLEERFREWKSVRAAESKEVQLQSAEDAAEFLRPFSSPHTGAFWSEEYAGRVESLFTQLLEASGSLLVWNPGCGNGYETYSLAAILRKLYPSSSIKIWAHDSDLLAISTAPNLVVQNDEIPDFLNPYMTKIKNGFSVAKELKDIILFEYHSVFHANSFPEVDLILARDLLSFQVPKQQKLFLRECSDKLKPGGVLLLGENERALTGDFEETAVDSIRAYRKNQQ